MATITRKELAQMLVEEIGCSFTKARKYVDSFFDSLIESIINGNKIEARGFGVFVVKEIDARPKARNPRTGETVYVPARRKVMFRPGKILKKELAQSREVGE